MTRMLHSHWLSEFSPGNDVIGHAQCDLCLELRRRKIKNYCIGVHRGKYWEYFKMDYIFVFSASRPFEWYHFCGDWLELISGDVFVYMGSRSRFRVGRRTSGGVHREAYIGRRTPVV